MAAIAKFVSFDGGIAFSDSVLKIQKRDEERGRLIPLDSITGVEVDEPLIGEDGCIRVHIAGERLSARNTLYFDDDQYNDALNFKSAFDSFVGHAVPELPPLEMFQPTSVARKPQKQTRYTERQPVRRKRRFKWWYVAIAVIVIAIIASPDKDKEQKNESAAFTPAGPITTPEPTPESTPEPTPVVEYTLPPVTTSPPAQEQTQTIVYVTNTGSKYHRSGCRHLDDSKIEMTLEEAKRYYEPCGTCHPPT